MLYLSEQDCRDTGVGMRSIIDALEAMFAEKGKGNVEMPPKPGIHTQPDAFIHAMPAFIPGLKAAGMKWISGYPGNQAKGLPYISGLMILNDPETGVPLAVMDATWLTAMRTGAATAVAARYLARPDSGRIGIVACGVQGRSNLEALASLFDLKVATVYDIDANRANRFAREIGDQLELEIQVVQEVEEAVREQDLVVTSGPILKHPTPVIEAGWLAKGSFASPVDFDSYWQGAAFEEADKICTDDVVQMEFYRYEGYFQQTPAPYADLGELAAGLKPGRESPEERTFSINLGLALEDVATAYLIHEAALRQGRGTELPL